MEGHLESQSQGSYHRHFYRLLPASRELERLNSEDSHAPTRRLPLSSFEEVAIAGSSPFSAHISLDLGPDRSGFTLRSPDRPVYLFITPSASEARKWVDVMHPLLSRSRTSEPEQDQDLKPRLEAAQAETFAKAAQIEALQKEKSVLEANTLQLKDQLGLASSKNRAAEGVLRSTLQRVSVLEAGMRRESEKADQKRKVIAFLQEKYHAIEAQLKLVQQEKEIDVGGDDPDPIVARLRQELVLKKQQMESLDLRCRASEAVNKSNDEYYESLLGKLKIAEDKAAHSSVALDAVKRELSAATEREKEALAEAQTLREAGKVVQIESPQLRRPDMTAGQLQSKVSALEAMEKKLKMSHAALTDELRRRNQELSTLQNTFALLKSSHEELVTQHSACSHSREASDAAVYKDDSLVDLLRKELALAENELNIKDKMLDAQHDMIQDELRAVKQNVLEAVAKGGSGRSGLVEVERLRGQITSHEQAFAHLTNEHKATTLELTTLQATFDLLRRKHEGLVACRRFLEEKIVFLEATIESKSSELRSRDLQYNAFIKRLQKADELKEKLEMDVKQFQEALLSAKDEAGSKAEKVRRLEEQVKLMEKDWNASDRRGMVGAHQHHVIVSRLHAEVDRLRTACRAHQQQNAFMNEEMTQLRSSHVEEVSRLERVVDRLERNLANARRVWRNVQLKNRALMQKVDSEDSLVPVAIGPEGESDSVPATTGEAPEELSLLKREYFYALARGVKLQQALHDQPLNLDIQALFERAQWEGIPFHDWLGWLFERVVPVASDVK